MENKYRDLQKLYEEWREAIDNALEEEVKGFRAGSNDCGLDYVRADFSECAGLDEIITFKEMLELERSYPKEVFED